MVDQQIPKSYPEFWDLYLREHQNRTNRWLHVVGTLASLVLLSFAITTSNYVLVLLMPIIGYLPAWLGHFFIEQNRPLSLRAPVWSIFSDYRLTVLMLAGIDPQAR